MKIAHSVLLGFILILILFTTTTLVNFRLYQAVRDNADYVSRSTIISKNSNRFQRNLLSMVNGLRGYLLTGERYFIESYDASNAENDTLLAELQSLLTDTAQKIALAHIVALNNKWTEQYTEPLRQAKMLSNVSIGRLDSFKKVYAEKYANGAERSIQQQLQLEFRNFINSEYAYRERRKADLEASLRKTKVLSVVFTSVSVFIAIVVIVLLVRRISRRIATMTSMANTIAEGDYEAHLDDVGNDELSSLGRSLNHMAAELSRNITLLKRRNEELDQFAHVVSHDLKGPLRGISNVVSWIEEDHSAELSSKLSNYMHLIKGRVLRGENLINGLLAYARADREQTEKEHVIVQRLIEEVLDDLPNRESMAVSIGRMPVLFTERILLFQVFSNLIGNAFKHNDKEHGFMRIYWVEHPLMHEFFVEDNGIGIDQKYHSRIFEIFQTLKERDGIESTGVGLAIVKKILDGKKQHIRLQSKSDSGAIFSFTWPKE